MFKVKPYCKMGEQREERIVEFKNTFRGSEAESNRYLYLLMCRGFKLWEAGNLDDYPCYQ